MVVKSDTLQVNGDIYRAFARVSNFSDLGGMMPPQISDWKATQDTCSFSVQGITVAMRIAQRVEPTLVAITSESGSPLGFTLAFHFTPAVNGGADAQGFTSRVEAELDINAIMGAVIKGQMQKAVNTLNEQIKRFAEIR